MTSNPNKLLGKRSLGKTGPPDIEVIPLGSNRKKQALALSSSSISNNNNNSISSSSSSISSITSSLADERIPNLPTESTKKLKPDFVNPPTLSQLNSSSSNGNHTNAGLQPQQPLTPQKQSLNNNNQHHHNQPQHHQHQQQQQQQQQQQPSNFDFNETGSTYEIIQSIYNMQDKEQSIKAIKMILSSLRSHLFVSNIPSLHIFTEMEKSPYFAFLTMVKSHIPLFLSTVELIDTLLLFFKRDATQLAQKKNNLGQVFASTILYTIYEDIMDWPAQFYYVYIDDASGDRIWVDDTTCRFFVNAIVTSIQPNQNNQNNEQTQQQQHVNRFQKCQNEIIQYTVTLIKQSNISFNARGMLRLLTLTIGFKESRVEGAQMIEHLLGNQNVFRMAKEYLQSLLAHCTENTPEDIRAVQILMRVQSTNTGTDITSTLLANNPSYGVIALRQAIELEIDLSNSSKSSVATNKSKLSAIFKHMAPQKAEEELAIILKELATREDYGNKIASRMLVRKIIKHFTTINIGYFCSQLIDIAKDELYLSKDPKTKERWAQNMVHIVCQTILLIPSSDIGKDLPLMRALISQITTNAVEWCSHLFLTVVNVPTEIIDMIKRVLFLDPINSYFPIPNNIVDSDRVAYRILSTEVQIQESTINVLLSFTKEPNVDKKMVLDLIDVLLRRAMTVGFKIGTTTTISNDVLAESILSLSEIGITGGIRLANASMFWQAAILVCFLVCLSPNTIGQIFWTQCPTLHVLLEMIVTRSWRFPPFPNKTMTSAQFIQADQAVRSQEKELTRLLADQIGGMFIIIVDLRGPARQPPDDVMERLQRLDQDFHLGYLLCQSRQPDFLLDIMTEQESRTSLSWLTHIISSDPRALEILPPLCLSEVLSMMLADSSYSNSTTTNPIISKLITRLTHFLTTTTTSQPTIEIIKYYFNQFTNINSSIRVQARRAISSLPMFKSTTTTPTTLDQDQCQFLTKLPTLHWFSQVTSIVQECLLRSLMVENDIKVIKSYIQYLYNQLSPDNSLLLYELSKLILNRGIISKYLFNDISICEIIFDIFSKIESFKTFTPLPISPTSSLSPKQQQIQQQQQQEIIIVNSGQETKIPIVILKAIIYSFSVVGHQSTNVQSKMNILNQYLFSPSIQILDVDRNQLNVLSFLDKDISIIFQSNNQYLIDLGIKEIKDINLIISKLFSINISNMTREKLINRLEEMIETDKNNIDTNQIPTVNRMVSLIELYKKNGLAMGEGFTKYLESLNQKSIPSTTIKKMSILEGLKLKKQTKSTELNNINNSSMMDLDSIKQQEKKDQEMDKEIENKQQVKELILKTNPNQLEKVMGKIFSSRIKVKEVDEKEEDCKLQIMVEAIQELHIGSKEPEEKDLNPNIGLLLDWLMVLVQQCSQSQIVKYLFPLMFTITGDRKMPFSTLLNTFIIHQTPWRTIANFVEAIYTTGSKFITPTSTTKTKQLSSPLPATTLDIKSIMTFLVSYHCHPRSGSPYYSNESTASTSNIDSFLHYITPLSMNILSDYVVEGLKSKVLDGDLEQDSLKLLTSAARLSSDHLTLLVKHLGKQAISPASQLVQRHLYYYFPNIRQLLPNQCFINNSGNSLTKPITKLDISIHRVILKIYEPDQRQEAFILFKSMALNHPEILSFQLPTILSLFSGRTYLTIDQFIQKKYHILFVDIVEILDLLVPHVFKQAPHLEKILNEYFMFLSNVKGFINELALLVRKFTEFLLKYIKSSTTANVLVNKHMDIIELLSRHYHSIKPVINEIQLNINCFEIIDIPTIQLSSHSGKLGEGKHSKLISTLKECIEMETGEKQIIELLERLDSADEIQEEHEELIKVLLKLTVCNRLVIRNLSYRVLGSIISSNSSNRHFITQIIKSLVSNLGNENPAVVKSTLSYIPSIYFLANDNDQILLIKKMTIVGRQSLCDIRKFILPFIKLQ